MTLEERLRRLEVLRRAMKWSDAEYELRKAEAIAKHEAEAGRERADRPAESRPRPMGGRGGPVGGPAGGAVGFRPPPREDLAIAPYRFVAVVDAVALPPGPVVAALDKGEGKLLSGPLPDGYCGEIAVTFAAETPLLIGRDSEEKGSVVPLDKGDGGPWWIPGASIRGMVRAAAEIVGYGRLEQANRHHVYPLRDFEHPYYNDPRGVSDGPAVGRASEVKGGWLTWDKDNDEYSIEPSELGFVAIDELLASGYVGGTVRAATEWVELRLEKKYELAGMGRGRNIEFSRTQKFADAGTDGQGRRRVRPAAGGGLKGVLVFSDRVPTGRRDPKREKKVEYALLTQPGDRSRERVTLEKEVWDRFELMHTRPGRGERRAPDGSWKSLQPIVADGRAVPVFYVGELAQQRDRKFAFGLTRLFKIPHRHRLGDMIDRMPAHRLVEKEGADYRPDLVGALFGFVHEASDLRRPADDKRTDNALKARVAFSGAVIDRKAARQTEMPDTVMSAPRASFAPFYLAGEVKDWSDESGRTCIAGRKRYLPRTPPGQENLALEAVRRRLEHQIEVLSPQAQKNEENKSRLQFLVPAEGNEIVFTSRIRLHNVLAEEIGLLLYVLTHGGDAGKRYRHMLGRAKPFGAGQLRLVSAKLDLERNAPKPGESVSLENADHGPFLARFVDYMRKEAGYRGSAGEIAAVRQSFPDTPAVRGFLGTADPYEGAKIEPPGGDTYPRLRLDDPRSGRPINPFNELRRATKLAAPDRPSPAKGFDRLLRTPEGRVVKEIS